MWRELQQHGAGDYLAVTTSYPLFMLKFIPEFRKILEDVLKIGRFWGGIGVMELTENLEPGGRFLAKTSTDNMWARITFVSIQGAGTLESTTALAVLLDECGMPEWELSHWQAIQRRVALNKARVWAVTTPYVIDGWLKREWYDRWKAGDPDYNVIQFSSLSNPAFPRDEFERARRTLPPWQFKMFYEGEYSKPSGAIYDCFHDGLLVDDFEIPKSWRRVIGVDFGGAHTAMLWLAQDPDTQRWFAYKEYMAGNVPSSEHCSVASMEARGCNPNKVEYYGGSPGETSYRMDWWENGIEVQQPPLSDVEVGISRVYQLMKDDKFRVFRSLDGLQHEFGVYRRKLDSAGQPTNAIQDAHTKHMLDALRVAVVGITEEAGVSVATFADLNW